MAKTRKRALACYAIQVQGKIDQSWIDWFSDMAIMFESGVTTFTGPVADQAALRGLLCRLWDLNLTLISVRRIEADGKEQNEND